MNLRTVFVAIALSISTAGCVATIQPVTEARDAVDFVPMANVANTFEIDSSRLALQRSRNPTVRSFAREMVRDHRIVGDRLAVAARRAGVPVMGPALDERRRDMLVDLASAPGAEFDELYMEMQVRAHREAISLFAAYARDGDDPSLRRFADRNLPVLRQHAVRLTRILGEATADAIASR